MANQENAHAHLNFLSTALQNQYVPRYAYLDNALDEFQVIAYVIDSGASPSSEFGPGQILDWLWLSVFPMKKPMEVYMVRPLGHVPPRSSAVNKLEWPRGQN